MSTTQINYVSPGVVDVTDGTGNATRMQFTSTGQIASITDPLNQVTQFSYDANDYLSQITAPGNKIYQFSYDAQGRLLSQTDPLNRTVSFTYAGSSDSPTSVTDQRGNVMTYSYDSSGNLAGISYANSTGETFTYNASVQLIQVVERSGDTFQYSYDSAGQLTRKTFDNGTFEQYTYDTKGNLTTVRDVNGGNTQMVYDAQDRLTKITYPNGRFLQYSYDAEGRRTQMVDQSGFTTNYSYDSAGRLSGLTNGTGTSIISYSYDAAGRLTQETNGNGTYTTYSYDAAGQLTGIINRKADNTINSSFQYTYDNLGRQTSAAISDGTWTYTYDAIGQLTRAQFASTNSSIANQDLRYTYDAAGNRTRAVINGVATNYTTDNLNQYQTVGTAQYTYDADGNLIQIVDGTNVTSYTYNDENRLIGVTSPTGSWTYEYDAFGNRTASIQNGVRTEYLVDPFGLGNVVGEYSGGTAANYVHGLGLVGRFNGSNAVYYDSDVVGSTVGLTNSAGSYVNRYVYRPYGENLITTEGVANSFEYVGQWGMMDETNGLDFMRARFYTPQNGRFMNSDPAGQTGGLNLYSYARNNPNNFIDITGNGFISVGRGIARVATKWFNAAKNLGKTAERVEPAKEILQTKKLSRDDPFKYGADPDNYRPGGDLDARGSASAELSLAIGIATLLIPELWPLGLAQDLIDLHDFLKNTPPFRKREPAPYPSDAAGNAARRLFDPLVLDLDGDGIELVSVEQSTVQFDLNADGFKELTGWVKADDGMLALDANGDGKINNITELFGDALTDGFDELKTLDSNNNNVIDASDAQFSQLKIWRDLNQNGITDVGELKTLAESSVQSISLNTSSANVTNEGNLIRTTGKYTRTDGIQRDAVALWFAADQLNTTYDQPYQLKPETLFLPTTRGYGGLPDLYIAASLDSQLLSSIRQFAGLSTQNLDQVQDKIQDILFRWAKVDGVDPTSRGPYFDARKLGFLEKFLQQNLDITFGSVRQTQFVQQAWDLLVKEISARLLVQGAMRGLFPNAIYSLNNDSLTIGDSLSTVLNRIATNIPSGSDNVARYWSYAISILDNQGDRFNLDQTGYDTQLKTALGSSGLSAYLDALRHPTYGSASNDILSGAQGISSFLDGRTGNDTIIGTASDDILNGGIGNDTITSNGGSDLIDGGAGTDAIGIEADYSTATNALSINDTSPPPSTLPNGTQIRNVETQWFIRLSTGSGNDRITFSARQGNIINTGAGNDTINAGLGNDSVDGGTGNDLLILDYSKGDTDGGMSFSAGNGINGAIRLAVGGGIALDGGIFYNIERFNITGTSKDDSIYSGSGNDTINSGTGNDTIDAGAGNDTVNAGEGNDTVNAGAGVDTVDGGSGTDKLILDLSTRTSNFNLVNYRSAGINLAGIVTAMNFEDFDIRTGSGNDTVTQAGEVNGVVIRGNDSISTGAGNDTINAGLGDNDQVDGGTGDDLLILDYSKGDTDGGLSFSASGGFGSAIRLAVGGGIALDGGIFYNIERFNITGTSKDDNIYTGAGNDSINAGAGNDSINAGEGNDTVDGGAGNDSINTSEGNDTVDGGAGNDKLDLNLSTKTTALNLTNYRSAGINIIGVVSAINFEAFDITTGSGNDTVTQAGLVNGTVIRGNDTISTGAGSDSINAGLGDNDVVDGGAGSDLLIVDYSAGDTGIGMYFSSSNGSGSAYRYVSAIDFNYLDYVSFSNIERFNITGTSKDDNIYTSAGNDTINAGGGNDTVDSSGGNDTVRGSGGNDIINGGAGNDTLMGDTGNDRLTGGTGADRFTFNAPTEGIDRITDFNISQADLIVVSAAGFGGGLATGASITPDQFVLGTAAADASDRFIYDSATGALRFDVDGTGATAAVQIATLGNKPILSNTNITVIA